MEKDQKDRSKEKNHGFMELLHFYLTFSCSITNFLAFFPFFTPKIVPSSSRILGGKMNADPWIHTPQPGFVLAYVESLPPLGAFCLVWVLWSGSRSSPPSFSYPLLTLFYPRCILFGMGTLVWQQVITTILFISSPNLILS